MYWGLTAMDLMGQLHRMGKDEVLEFVRGCHDDKSGGFAPTLHHDPHLLYTLSAIQVPNMLTFVPIPYAALTIDPLQVLTLYDSLTEIDIEGVVKYVAGLQQPDGSFAGDKWGKQLFFPWQFEKHPPSNSVGEIDTRFSFCALATLALLVSWWVGLEGVVVSFTWQLGFRGGWRQWTWRRQCST